MKNQRSRIAGVEFDLLDADRVLERIRMPIPPDTEVRRYISLVNPHSVMMCHRDAELREAIRYSWLTLPDGVGIVLGAKILAYEHRGRLSGPELMLQLCDRGRPSGLRHYFFGGEEGVAQKVAENLREMYPGMKVAGWACPPFRAMTDQENAEAIERINAAKPHIVWVGLGAPKQEKWMARHARNVRGVLIGVGAAFDFHSGNKPWCPAPLRRAGLEWAYRLAVEPTRLWRRNIDSLLFLRMVAAEAAAAALEGHYLRRPPILDREQRAVKTVP